MAIERIVPDECKPEDLMLQTHLERYEFAKDVLRPEDVVIDAACGTGYGSQLLAHHCRFVYGYDRDPAAIKYARERYHEPNVTFTVLDLEREQLPGCDVLVSLETVEHLSDPQTFLDKCKSVVSRLIVLSTPIDPTKHINQFHLQDFTKEEVEAMMMPWIPTQFMIQVPDVRCGLWVFKRR